MNNDFNFTPRKPEPKLSTNQPAPNGEPLTAEATSTQSAPEQQMSSEAETAPVQQQVMTSRQPSGFGRKFLKFLGLLLLLAFVGGSVWYYQQMRIESLADSHGNLEKRIASLETQAPQEQAASEDDAPATPTETYNVVTGSVTTTTGTGADVSVHYLPDTARELWIEYGTKPDELKNSTKRVQATGAGTAGSYITQGFSLTGLQAGTEHYYRAAATVNGQTVYGGVVAFETTK